MIYKDIEIHKTESYYWFRVVEGKRIISSIYISLGLAKGAIDNKSYLWQ